MVVRVMTFSETCPRRVIDAFALIANTPLRKYRY